jgi:hypothetical protein
MNPFIFVFLDGFGLGDATLSNPIFTSGITAFEEIAGNKLLKGIDVFKSGALFKGIDATLGVDGLPQSATGQTALFTGKNAPEILGFHLPAFPDKKLIELIGMHNILKKLNDAGYRSTFANAYSDNYFERVKHRKNMHSVTTHCVLSAGLRLRKEKDLMENNAIYWDIIREHFQINYNPQVTTIDPFCAGEHLAQISRSHEFVLFECFATDLAGHSCDDQRAKKILATLDSFFSGILKTKDSSTNLLICSDHGNIEDLRVKSHTTNQVPLIVIGPDAQHFCSVERIDQVTPQILALFGI